jgi:hypothetical protein
MGSTTIPAPNTSLTRRVTTLTSGTSWTVPAGVTFVNVTLVGGGGGGGNTNNSSVNGAQSGWGMGGSVVSSTLTTTPGASITYAIGAGGTATNVGGNTTFTGATTAVGGNEGGRTGNGDNGPNYLGGANGGQPAGSDGAGTYTGGQGGSGSINVEYWV